MSQGVCSIHQVANRKFSSLFSVQGGNTDQIISSALKILGLEEIKFTSLDDNLEKLRRGGNMSPLLRGPEGSLILNVPGFGDCWLVSVLAPLVGKVIDKTDSEGIIRKTRKRMSEMVLSNAEKFVSIFGGRFQELETWAAMVKQWQPAHHLSKWGGDTEFEVFTRLTGICVHVLQKEDKPGMCNQPVTHFLPRLREKTGTEAEQWSVSCVVMYS